MAEREGFELTPRIGNTQVADSALRKKRQNRIKRYTKVQPGYKRGFSGRWESAVLATGSARSPNAAAKAFAPAPRECCRPAGKLGHHTIRSVIRIPAAWVVINVLFQGGAR